MSSPTDAAASVPTEPVAAPTPAPSGPRAAGRDALAVLGVSLALGALAGVLWWLVVDPARFVLAEGGGLGMGETELGRRFADDGWYAVIAAVAGLFSGAALTWWRSRDPLLTALLVLVGAFGAGGLMAAVGALLGPADPEAASAGAEVGTVLPTALEVTGAVGYLVWPITALIGALLVLWSPGPDPEQTRTDTPV